MPNLVAHILCLLLTSVHGVHASLFNHEEALGMACAYAAGTLFPQCDVEHYACYCTNTTFLGVVSNCIQHESHHNSTVIGTAYDKFVTKFCEIHNVPISVDIEEAATMVNTTVHPEMVVNRRGYLRAYEAEQNNMSQKETSMWLGLGLVFYWVLLAGCSIINNTIAWLSYRYLAHPAISKKLTFIERMYLQYVKMPSIIGSRHMSRFEFFKGYYVFNIPLRDEFLFAFFYGVLVLIFMLTPYDFMDGDILYPSKWKQMMRYASDRSGIMATIQFPVLFLFAAKNNVLIPITGWSYMKCNVFHRIVSVVIYILLIIHAVMKHIFSRSYGGSLVKYYYPVPYFRWGVSAMGLMALIFLSVPLRSRLYSIIYRLHQCLAAGVLVCSIMHLQNLPFKTPLYIACGIWGCDWIYRFLRIGFFNAIIPAFKPLPESKKTTFAVAILYDNNNIALSVHFPIKWRTEPGQYVFVHFYGMNISGGHPFSVLGPTTDGNGLRLMITPRNGTTRTLLNRLKNKGCNRHNPVSIKVWVEGPYGLAVPVQWYDVGLLFCGGIGITGVLAYLSRMSMRENRVIPRRVVLFWAVAHPDDVYPVRTILAENNLRDGVEIRIFCRKLATDPNFEKPIPKTDTWNSDISLSCRRFSPQLCEVQPQGKNEKDKNLTVVRTATSGSETDTDSFHSGDDSALVFSSFSSGNDNTDFTGRQPHYSMNYSRPSSPPMCPISPSLPPMSPMSPISTIPGTGPLSPSSSHPMPHSMPHPMPHSLPTSLTHPVSMLAPPRRGSSLNAKNGAVNGPQPPQHKSRLLIRRPNSDPSTEGPTSNSREFGTNAGPIQEENEPVDRYTNRKRNTDYASPFNPIVNDPNAVSSGPTAGANNGFEPSANEYGFETSFCNTNEPGLMNEVRAVRTNVEVGRIDVEPVGMDIMALLKEYISASTGSVCVIGCGPDSMMDNLRWGCNQYLPLNKNGRVDYYEEAMRW